MFTHSIRARAALAGAAALAVTLAAVPALAREVRGVDLKEQKQVAGKLLVLNGAGTRTMFGFPTYVAGLYVEEPGSNAEQLVTSKQVKRLELHMLRDMSKQQIGDAIEKGVRSNTPPDEMPKLEGRLGRLTNALPDLSKGQVMTVTHEPGKGLTVDGPTLEPVTLKGQDFAEAAFKVWLGPEPVQSNLKRDLLEGARAAPG